MTRTETIDHLYAATWAARLKDIVDNIFKKHVFWAWISASNKVKKVTGGIHIEEQLMYAKNTTFGSIGKGGTVSINPTDPITLSKWQWKTTAGSIVRYRDDQFKNRGPHQVSNMVANQIKVAELSMADEMTTQVFGDGTGNNSKDIDGLKNIVADDPTASGSYSTVGGISLSGNSWWENQYQDMTSFSFESDGRSKMATMVNNCEDGGDMLDLILTSQTLFEQYEDEVVGIQNIMPTEAKRNKIADLGFRTLYFKEIPMSFDKNMPDTDKMYFLNSNYLNLVGDTEQEWFEMTPWEPVQRQPKDRVAYILLTANLTSSNRRRQGVMFNFT